MKDDYGFKCSECGFKPSPGQSWRRCGPEHFCSTDCAVEFLLRREGMR